MTKTYHLLECAGHIYNAGWASVRALANILLQDKMATEAPLSQAFKPIMRFSEAFTVAVLTLI